MTGSDENSVDWDEYDEDIHVGPEYFDGQAVRFQDFVFSDTDFFLISILKDMVLSPEFCWANPNNVEYGGCYRVRDYQVKFNRTTDHYAGFSCARSVGKTEREKIAAFTHYFKRAAENLLLTAPELLHLHPLAREIEDRIERCRLSRECLRRDKPGMTGFSHNPFGVEYADGTKIVGRIPNRDGRGVKGQHQRDLIIEEAQDYPDAGWTEVHEMLPLDEQVLTPSGFVDMGDVSVGDLVIGVDGNQVEVIAESLVKEREVWEVVLSDSTVIRCDREHLWEVSPRPGRTPRVLRTENLIGRRWALPENGLVDFSPIGGVTIDPYLLGLLIGDGGFTQASTRFSSMDEDVLAEVSRRLPSSDKIVHDSGCDYRIVNASPSRSRALTRLHLDELGLGGLGSHEKFIPMQYMVASKSDRLEILRGLVDSDGNIHRSGSVRFGTTSKVLADGVEFIVRSLGGSVSRSERRDKRGFKMMHCLHFRLPEDAGNPARMDRKAKAYRPKMIRQPRWIESVRPTGSVEKMKCIKIADGRGLFLASNFVPTHNTVMKEGDFTYHFYGVHRGARGGGFARRVQGGMFKIHTLTAIQRPGWGPEEKQAAIDTYGGVNSPDYRRNILGEPGAASSPIFVVARLMACVDQDLNSDYNQNQYVQQHLRWEDFSQSGLKLEHVIDLPSVLKTKKILVGMDLGLTNSPTVCSVFAEVKHRAKGEHAARDRLALIRRFTLQHFKSRDIRHLAYLIWRWRNDVLGIGMDTTGLGFPIFQEIEDDESYPDAFKSSVFGWKFNEKIEIANDSPGGDAPQEGMPFFFAPQEEQKGTMMTVIEATTNFMREWVDSNYLLLPMDNEVVEDLLAENVQRVQDVSRLTGSKKPNRFHILDSFRMASLVERMSDGREIVEQANMVPILDRVIDPGMM